MAARVVGQKPILNTQGIVAYYYTEQIAQKLGNFRETYMVCSEKTDHRTEHLPVTIQLLKQSLRLKSHATLKVYSTFIFSDGVVTCYSRILQVKEPSTLLGPIL